MYPKKTNLSSEVAPKKQRIQKILAHLGVGSRRSIESMIAAGRVRVNGKLAVTGDKIDSHDIIKVDGQRIYFPHAKAVHPKVLLYHKPEGEICTRQDPEGRKTVYEQLPQLNNSRWISVGRLDINTSGLLLFTNDGELAEKMMHPRYEVEREYAVRVLGEVTEAILQQLRTGVSLADGPGKFDNIVFAGGDGANQWFHVILKEGRQREVRRLWEACGLQVSRLIRIRFGDIKLPRDLRQGHYRYLTQEEIKRIDAS